MIFIAGPHGAGKTTIAEMLADYSFDYLDLGGILRGRHQKESPEINFREWCARNEGVFGPCFTDDVLVGEIAKRAASVLTKSSAPRDLVIVGSRSLRGVRYIMGKTPLFNGRRNIIIYVNAPIKILRQRYCAREKVRLTAKEFQVIIDSDNQMGLGEITSFADIKVLNAGSKRNLRAKVKRLISTGCI
jgi:dephospho-CoA kinase